MTSKEVEGPLLEVGDLEVSFAIGGRFLRAVRGVDFTLAEGDALGIVGESGSGKSVTARSILGLLSKTRSRVSGSIVLDGRQIVGLDDRGIRDVRRHTASMIFQDPMRSLNPTMSVWSQLRESLKASMPGAGKREVRARARELLDLVHMPAPEERLRSYPHQLSGGMRQRVGIAMALASKPKLLIADEPTTALDVTVQAQILDLLDALRRDLGMAMILITHDLAVATERTDHIAVMYGGKIVESARTKDLLVGMRMPYTRALFESTPGPATPRRSVLPAIPGRPPGLAQLPSGCSFADRCFHRSSLTDGEQDRCVREDPPSITCESSEVRCWFPLATGVARGAR
jgi:oligopeptide/dipeptide ABC transporter ATP-binding protein